MKNYCSLLLLTCGFLQMSGQATFNSSGVYTQDFGTTSVGSWSNNSTFQGWYADLNAGSYLGTINVTTSAPSNSGGIYSYTCNGASNILLGTRPSNGSGAGPCDATPTSCGHKLGLRLENNLGSTIYGIRVQYTGYQLSLAQNGNVSNVFSFHYQTGNSVSSLTSGTWTAVSSLDYTAPNNSGVAGSSQISGYPCTVSSTKNFCIPVTINSGDQIMLRWNDANNSNNDPHFAIDNVTITAYTDNACTLVLPLELTSFTGTGGDRKIDLQWHTASEKNLEYFELQKSYNAFDFFPLSQFTASNSITPSSYYYTDNFPLQDLNYYRLKISEFSGETYYSSVIEINTGAESQDQLFFDGENLGVSGSGLTKKISVLRIFNVSGKCFFEKILASTTETVNIRQLNLEPGIYFAALSESESITQTCKIVVVR